MLARLRSLTSTSASQLLADAGLLAGLAFHLARCSPASAALWAAAAGVHALAGAHTLRWQMRPALLAGACASAAALAPLAGLQAPQWWWVPPAGLLRAAGACALAASAAAAFVLFPLRAVPPKTGPYEVGMRVFHLEEEEEDGGGGRVEFNVRVYYPAAADAPVRRSPYLRHGTETARAFAAFAGLPAFVMEHMALQRVRLAAEGEGVAAAADRHPLVLFSHGLGGTCCCYQAVIAELASHGMVVLAVEHNDLSAAVTVLKGGRARPYRQLRDLMSERGATEFEVRSGQLRRRARELVLALDWAQESDEAAALFAGRVDARRAAAAGHSFGAATCLAAAEAAGGRVAAVAALDCWMFPLGEGGADTGAAPVLFLQGEGFRAWRQNNERMAAAHARAAAGSRLGTLAGARHQTFSDFVCLAPAVTRLMRQHGSADPDAAVRLVARVCAGYLASALALPPSAPASRWRATALGEEPPQDGLEISWEGGHAKME